MASRFDSVFSSKAAPSTKSTGNDFNPDVLGNKFTADQAMYDKFSDQAYGQATRLLDPQFDRMRKDFDQRAVNQGFSQGSEGYNTAFDQHMRQQNDAYNQAAFGAMDYGNQRLDADRNFDEGQRQFDSSLSEGGRQFDKGDLTNRYNIDTNAATSRANTASTLSEQGRQFDAAQELRDFLGYEGIASGYRDDAYRDAVFNSQSDQQQFDNLFRMQGLIPGQEFAAGNPSNAFANSAAQGRYDQSRDDALYQGIGESISNIGTSVDWGSLFGGGSTQTAQPVGNLYDSNWTPTYTGTGGY